MALLRHLCPLLLLLLAACAAPGTQSGADGTPGSEPASPVAGEPDAAPAPAPVAPATQGPKKAPPMSKPLPPQKVAEPVAIDRSCRTDADCAVKDVGNCCGYFPACVNKDSPTDPAAVRAQCEASGMASVCGFREIASCACNAGTCEASSTGALPAAQ